MSSRALFTIIAVFLFSSFVSSKITGRSSLFMVARGVQKLGQSVIGTTVPPAVQGPDSTSPSVFKRPPIGSGCDDRTVITPFDEDKKWATISKVDKMFQQRSLLMGLEGSSWGSVEKLERVRNAVLIDSLLPSSFSSELISASNLKAGGLMSEW